MAQVARTRQQLIDDLLKLDRDYAALLSKCSREQLNWRPAIGAWSVAQCIQHVAGVNSIYLSPIKAAIAKGRMRAPLNGESLRTAGWFSAFFLKSVSPEGTVKLRAPRIARPSADPSNINADEALRTLRQTHAEIREILTSSEQPDLNRLRFKNPFVPLIRFTVGTGILIMVGHGRRHLLQAERVCGTHDFPQARASAGTTD
jgi:hypothetical protein